MPGTQGVLHHVSGCFGEDEQGSPKCSSLRQIHQPGPGETTPSSKAWMTARNGSCGSFQRGSPRNVSGAQANRQTHRKMWRSWKGLPWNWPLSTSSRRENEQPFQALCLCSQHWPWATSTACVMTSNGVGIYFKAPCLQNCFNHVCWVCQTLQNDQFRKFDAVGLFPDD